MTDEQIMALAARYSAYADTKPTLRGHDILAFARELLDERDAEAAKALSDIRERSLRLLKQNWSS